MLVLLRINRAATCVKWSPEENILLLDLEQDLFLFVILNRNMIGGLPSISKNRLDQQLLQLIGTQTMFCWLQVHLDLRSEFTLVTLRTLNQSHLQLPGVIRCLLPICWQNSPIVSMEVDGFTL